MNEPQPKANMIEETKSYKVGNKIFGTISEAQVAALEALLCPTPPSDSQAHLISDIVAQAGSVVEILLMREPAPRTRKPRSDQGKPHRKKKAVAANPEPAPIESTVEGSGKYSGK